ncbi:dormancy-associated protein homolog 3-like [Zingiber officinale]|uniref:dormancy-associated protein homolog 3-like n=1 Tax=Zingiber officinale TaxID=94328 RepID=UPI001C4D81DA|nr:dormancy-associated protein homolog 3-like [Zingiber officinale]
MGLLDKLWDDTLAGPRPDSGLGRLRKPLSFSLRTAAKDESESPKGGWTNAAGGDGPAEETPMRVTRSIMIKRPPGWASPGSGATPPTSPAGSTTPKSPFSGAGGKEGNRFSRRWVSEAYRRKEEEEAGSSSSCPPFDG